MQAGAPLTELTFHHSRTEYSQVLLGNGAVGKSSLVGDLDNQQTVMPLILLCDNAIPGRFCKEGFTQVYKQTVGGFTNKNNTNTSLLFLVALI